MAVDPQQLLAQMNQLEEDHYKDLAKNNDKFKALWALCSKRGHMAGTRYIEHIVNY